MTETDNRATVKISKGSNLVLKRLAKNHGVSVKKFTEEMIDYMNQSGIDPMDKSGMGAAEQIRKLDKRLVGFILNQERYVLKPTANKLEVLVESLQEELLSHRIKGVQRGMLDMMQEQERLSKRFDKLLEILTEYEE